MKKNINYFNGGGSTNILSGMEIAADVLKSRRFTNDVTSIFLLTDGQDDQPSVDERVKRMFEDKKLGRKADTTTIFTVNTFGYGSDHQPDMMRNIAQYKDGGFYYIDKLKSVSTCFLDALGGLVSVVCEDVKVSLKSEKKAPLTDLRISKTYGTAWSFNEETREHQITLNQLLGGISRDFVLQIKIPSVRKDFKEEERTRLILTAKFCGKSIDTGKGVIQISKKAQLVVDFYNESDVNNYKRNLKIDDDVLIHLFRVKTAKALNEAIKASEKSNYEEGRKVLRSLIKEIKEAEHLKNEGTIQYLLKDLNDAWKKCKPITFESYGKIFMVNNNHIHMNQQSNQYCAAYSNLRQQRFQGFLDY